MKVTADSSDDDLADFELPKSCFAVSGGRPSLLLAFMLRFLGSGCDFVRPIFMAVFFHGSDTPYRVFMPPGSIIN